MARFWLRFWLRKSESGGKGAGACALAALAVTLTFTHSAAADDGPRFVGTIHGGAATEAGGGATVEVRVFDEICVGGSFDLGINLVGTRGSYGYYSPVAQGSYRIKLAEIFELRPIFGARFPLGVTAMDESEYKIIDNSVVAFTAGLRASFLLSYFVVGIQGDFTPHVVTWQEVSTGKAEETDEFLVRASLVVGIAIGGD